MPTADHTKALISIHDVMPETLSQVSRILELLERGGAPVATLLVVPGRAWTPSALAQLRALQSRGYELAGHGWRHRVERYGGIHHRLHSLLISRDVAEHLALDSAGIEQLIARCFAWFADHDLPAPRLYVPPAWALGRLASAKLTELPFRQYELLGGVVEASNGRMRRLPLTGYEADAGTRASALRLWNQINRQRARRRRWLRIAIHPNDLGLPLADSLTQDLIEFKDRRSYDTLEEGVV